MLPDLRIVIVAVLSTFVLTVGVGFYASSRLINEPKKRTDSLAAMEESPVNRIALSWPEPIRQSEPLALDFAVTARALRNPVREVTSEPAAPVPQPKEPALRVTAAEPAGPAVSDLPAKNGEAPARAASDATAPAPAPAPDIRIAVQYPPVVDLPRELQTPAVAPSSPATPAHAVAPPLTTGSIAATTAQDEPRAAAPQPDRNAPESAIARLPEPAEAGTPVNPTIEQSVPAKPVKSARKKTSPRKAAKKTAKAAKRPVRRVVSRVNPRIDNHFPMNFFGLSTN